MTNEIILSPYQATVFTAAEARLKTQGYLGMALFEDTYVLSKKLAQHIVTSIPPSQSGNTDWSTQHALIAYRAVLDIEAPPPAEGITNTSSGDQGPPDSSGQTGTQGSTGGSEGGSITPVSNN
jgi:hypothetical protein